VTDISFNRHGDMYLTDSFRATVYEIPADTDELRLLVMLLQGRLSEWHHLVSGRKAVVRDHSSNGRQETSVLLPDENERPFSFATMWERWQGAGQKLLDTCTMFTTNANEVFRLVHDRMPVILHPEDYEF